MGSGTSTAASSQPRSKGGGRSGAFGWLLASVPRKANHKAEKLFSFHRTAAVWKGSSNMDMTHFDEPVSVCTHVVGGSP